MANGQHGSDEVSIARNIAAFTVEEVSDAAVLTRCFVELPYQIHGGIRFMRESEVERHYSDQRVLRIGGGTTEMLNEVITKRFVGNH